MVAIYPTQENFLCLKSRVGDGAQPAPPCTAAPSLQSTRYSGNGGTVHADSDVNARLAAIQHANPGLIAAHPPSGITSTFALSVQGTYRAMALMCLVRAPCKRARKKQAPLLGWAGLLASRRCRTLVARRLGWCGSWSRSWCWGGRCRARVAHAHSHTAQPVQAPSHVNLHFLRQLSFTHASLLCLPRLRGGRDADDCGQDSA